MYNRQLEEEFIRHPPHKSGHSWDIFWSCSHLVLIADEIILMRHMWLWSRRGPKWSFTKSALGKSWLEERFDFILSTEALKLLFLRQWKRILYSCRFLCFRPTVLTWDGLKRILPMHLSIPYLESELLKPGLRRAYLKRTPCTLPCTPAKTKSLFAFKFCWKHWGEFPECPGWRTWRKVCSTSIHPPSIHPLSGPRRCRVSPCTPGWAVRDPSQETHRRWRHVALPTLQTGCCCSLHHQVTEVTEQQKKP